MKLIIIALVLLFSTVYGDLTRISLSQKQITFLSGYQDQIYLISNSPTIYIFLFNISTSTFIQQTKFTSTFDALTVNSKYVFVYEYANSKVLQLNLGFNQTNVISNLPSQTVMACNEQFLIIGGQSSLEMWDIENWSLVGYDLVGFVYSLTISDTSIFLCQDNDNLNIQQRDTSAFNFVEAVYSGHSDVIYSLLVYDNHLFSGSGDTTIIQWSLDTQGAIMTYTGHAYNVIVLTASGGYLFSGSQDAYWIQWEISSGTLIRSVNPFSSTIYGLYIFDGNLYCAGLFGFFQYVIPELNPTTTTTSTTTTTMTTTSTTNTPTTITTTTTSTTPITTSTSTKTTTTTTATTITTTSTTSTATTMTTTSTTTGTSTAPRTSTTTTTPTLITNLVVTTSSTILQTTTTTTIFTTPSSTHTIAITTPVITTTTLTVRSNTTVSTTVTLSEDASSSFLFTAESTLETTMPTDFTTTFTQETNLKQSTKENSNAGQSQDSNIGYYVGAPIMALVLLITTGFIALHFIRKKKEGNAEIEEKNQL